MSSDTQNQGQEKYSQGGQQDADRQKPQGSYQQGQQQESSQQGQ
jgi:hypothetical protein